ncbi:MAG: class I SAM-dependent methyltransferase [Pseudomonadota bacterium]
MDTYSLWKNWNSEDFGRFSKRESRYFAWHLQRALGTATRLNVLEIGFGNGGFMGWLRHAGHRVAGVEHNEHLLAAAKSRGFTVAGSLDKLPAETYFDLIAAFDVIEHIPVQEIQPWLGRLRSLCKPAGRLLLRCPNGDSPFGLPHQNGDVTHVTSIGVSKLRQLAMASGWSVTQTGEAPWWADQHFSRSLGSALRATVRMSIESLVGYAYFHGRVDLAPNLFAVLQPAALEAAPE